MNELIEIYFNESSRLVQSLREAIIQGDVSAMEKRAHSLKSSSANLGALTLADHCKELETRARANSPERATEVMSELDAEYQRVRVALAAVLSPNIGWSPSGNTKP